MNGLSLCSGIGALDDGLRIAEPDYKPVVFVERESFAASVLVARMEAKTMAPAPIWDEIESFDGRPYRGIADIVTAGFPCLPWSSAGKRRGIDDAGWIWHDIARIIAESEPTTVLLENVEGLCRHGGLACVVADLAALRFAAAWDVFSAAGVGAPHRRRRLYLVARRVSNSGCIGLQDNAERPERRSQTTDERNGKSIDLGTKVVADGYGDRPQSIGGGKIQNENAPYWNDTDGCCLPLWPPASDDLSAWRCMPMDYQPAVCRLVDGAAAYRREWLHAIGNAVVPLVAAYAYRILQARLDLADDRLA